MIRSSGWFVLSVVLALPILAQTARELRVLLASPQGVTTSIDQSAQVIAVFSEPMTALTTAPEGEGKGPMTIEPSVRGKYRWLGTTTLAFEPDDTLAFATKFTVTIPQGTRSLSGIKLKSAYLWTFETPRPSVVRTAPASGQRRIEPGQEVMVVFNQPIDLLKIGQWVSLEERAVSGATSYPSYTLRRPSDDELSLSASPYRRVGEGSRVRSAREEERLARERECALVVVPSMPFKKGSAVRLVCKSGLEGKEGRLGMTADYAATFSVYGDLKFLGVQSESDFAPANPLRFDFTNPVSTSELLRHITLEPQAKQRPGYGGDYASEKQYVQFELKPETQYAGKVTAGLKDIFGNALEADEAFSFRTGSFAPSVRMTTGPGLVEADEEHKIPVTFLNCDSVELSIVKIEPDEVIPLIAQTDFYSNEEVGDAVLRRVPKENRIERIWRVDAKRNTSVVKTVDLDEALGKNEKGIALVQVRRYGRENERVLKTVAQVTAIGLTAKFSPESILIWATRLKDVSPVAEAEVEVRTDSNRVVWRGRTDARGVVTAPGWGALGIEPVRQAYGEEDEYESSQPPRLWVIVKKDGDCAFTSSQWNEGIEPYAFGLEAEWNPQPEQFEASLFTDRGLYKANETVNVKGIVRVKKDGAWRASSAMSLRVSVKDPRNDDLFVRTVALNEYGSFSLAIPLKSSARTGFYRMSAEVRRGGAKGRWRSVAAGTFRVEAFRPAEFEVRAGLGHDSYTTGDSVRGFVSARYLFGAPVKKAPVKWRFTLSPASFTPTGWEAYSFGALDWLSDYSESSFQKELASGEGALDEMGSIDVSAVIAKTGIARTMTLMLEGDAASVSRQTLSGRVTALVHAGEYYVGVKPSATFLAADSVLDVSLVAVTKDGAVVAGRPITLKIERRIWHSVRKAETGGRYAWQTETADSLVDSLRVTSGERPLHHTFTPHEPGFYFMTASSADDRGNIVQSQTTIYVSGPGYVPWQRTDDDRIELVADKANYAPGEKASILVKNPYERATALISVEREGIMSHYTTELEGSAPRISLPIEHAYLPNVFVSVVLLQGRIAAPAESQESDVGRPSFKLGYVMLSVSPKEKRLTVHVEMSRPDYHPGDTVSAVITVRGTDGRGKRSELTVSAADEGVLSLIGYQLPDPFEQFYKERGLAVTTTETRLHLISQRNYGEKGEDAGGGGMAFNAQAELDAEGIRKDFRPSAYWNPALLTDDSGRATVRFKLPDNITAFKLMAVAQTLDAEFGSGAETFRVSKPVLLQPSMPRLARTGDVFDAGVVVVNYTNQARSVALSAAASGIQLRAKDTVRVELEPGQAREVSYRFKAEKVGTAVVTVKAQSGEERDGLRWTFPVAAPRAKETTALFNSVTEAKREETMFLPQSIVPDQGGVEVTASSTALVGLSGGMTYLFTYPYGCLEQRVSSVLPIILAGDLVEAFHLEVFKGRDYKTLAQKTIDELLLFQKWNGGFSYWKSVQETSPYLSAYALLAMLEARDHGYAVDKRALAQGLDYLTRVKAGEERGTHFSFEADACTRALTLYTLARSGKADFGAMDRLFSERARLPLFAKAYLMRAAALGGKQAPVVDELARDLINHAKVDPTGASFEEPSEAGMAWIFHSNTRTTAIVLQALVESDKATELDAKIVRRLLNVQRNGRWRTTQENLYVVSALAAYFKKYEHEEPDFSAAIRVSGQEILSEMFKGRSLETKKADEAIARLPKGKNIPVEIEKQGAGRLYYGIRLNYIPKGDVAPRNEGMTLLRSMEPAEGGAQKEIRAGMLMKVTLTVIAYRDRHYVAVDDPVPAGFEIVATTFATSASNLGEENREYSSAFNHTERYDDRVSLFADYMPAGIHSSTYLVRAIHPGTFVVPSARAECMYEPEVFATTQSGTVTIR